MDLIYVNIFVESLWGLDIAVIDACLYFSSLRMPSGQVKLLWCFICCVVFVVFFNDFVLAVVRGEREGSVDKLEEGWNICESIGTGWVLRNWVCVWTSVLYAGTGSMWPKGWIYLMQIFEQQSANVRKKEECLQSCWWQICIFSSSTEMDIFIATNRMCRGRIEFFLERPYLGRATILLNEAFSRFPSLSKQCIVGSDISFCSPLCWCQGGATHYWNTATGLQISLALPFHSMSSVPSLLARDSSLPKWTLLSLAVPWAALCLYAVFCVLFLCFADRPPSFPGCQPSTVLPEWFSSPCWQLFPPSPRSSSASINPMFGPSVPISLYTGSSRSIAKPISLPQK